MALASQAKAVPKGDLYHGEDKPDQGALPTFSEMKESFRGDVYGEAKRLWKERLEADSRRQRGPGCGARVSAAEQPALVIRLASSTYMPKVCRTSA